MAESRALLLLVSLSWVLPSYASVDGERQTIGEYLDRSGQNPDRLITQKPPKREIPNAAQAIEDARLSAIEHYERVISLSAEPAVRAESLRRAADLKLEYADSESAHLVSSNQDSGSVDEQDKSLGEAIKLYTQLLTDYPDYSAADLVLYQLARAYDLNSMGDRSIDVLRQLSAEFPQSKRVSEASFRAAEMLYLRKRYEEAIVEYQRITTAESDAEFWWLAQYKQAWTYYQLDNYRESVASFAQILNEVDLSSDAATLEDILLSAIDNNAEIVRDTVRGMSKAFSKFSKIEDINDYLAGNSGRYYPVIYRGVAEIFSQEKRYTDAASMYESFSRQYPSHELAKQYSELAIEQYVNGGFRGLAVAAQEQYIAAYGAGSELWEDQEDNENHRELVHQYMEAVVAYRHAEAQQLAKEQNSNAKPHYSAVADRYAEIISTFPNDKSNGENIAHYADTLYESDRFDEAAIQYGKLAYEPSLTENPADAALAQVKSYRQWFELLKREGASEDVLSESRKSVFESISAFASRYPTHEKRSFMLLAAAEDYYQLDNFNDVIAISLPLVNAGNWKDESLHNKALGLLADAYFSKEDYVNAEKFYIALVPRIESDSNDLKNLAQSRLAISVYRQAEEAKDDGAARIAANLFQRAASLSTDKTLVADAMFNAAGQLYELKDWGQSASVLNQFVSEFSGHQMILDAEKMLAIAYEKSANPQRAAAVYERIAHRKESPAALRRTAQLTAGKLYISAGRNGDGERVLTSYLKNYPNPLGEAQKIRLMIAGLYPVNSTTHLKWLRNIVVADETSGRNNSASQLLAADASYTLAMLDVKRANAVSLTLPIEKSLPRRRAAMEKAISALMKTSSYGFSDVSTLANFELGELYRKFAIALMESEVPKKMDDDVLEQYMILLEEQAYPFEEKAIAEYETNMALVGEGVWTSGVRKSLFALAKLAPAKYGKQPKLEKVYDSLY
ncbi:tetratricopeptide repeat protein [Zhongshania aliphaticivorans]|nr:tetratricopeptide repeat protein [Zhongshania aliphaticivorans]